MPMVLQVQRPRAVPANPQPATSLPAAGGGRDPSLVAVAVPFSGSGVSSGSPPRSFWGASCCPGHPHRCVMWFLYPGQDAHPGNHRLEHPRGCRLPALLSSLTLIFGSIKENRSLMLRLKIMSFLNSIQFGQK